MYIKNIIFLAFAFSLKDLSCLAALIQVCMLVHYQKVFPVSDHNNNIDTSVDGGLSFAGKQRTGGTLESMIDHTLTCSTLDSPSSFSSTTQPVERGIFHKAEGGQEKVYRQGIGAGSDLPILLNKQQAHQRRTSFQNVQQVCSYLYIFLGRLILG